MVIIIIIITIIDIIIIIIKIFQRAFRGGCVWKHVVAVGLQPQFSPLIRTDFFSQAEMEAFFPVH